MFNPNEQPEIEIARTKEYKIEPFKNMYVGDPCYEKLENRERLVLDETFPHSKRTAGLVVQELNVKFTDIQFKQYKVIAYSIKGESGQDIIDTHKENAYFPNLIKEMKELSCDSAGFDIEVNGRFTSIDTGADGKYGAFYHYKDNAAFILELDLPDDYMPVRRYLIDLALVFNCKDLLKELGVKTPDKTTSKDKY